MRTILPLLLIACGSTAPPAEGTWAYDNIVARTDECGIANMWEPGAGFDLAWLGADITISPPYGDSFACTLDKGEATCDEAYAGSLAFIGAAGDVSMSTALSFTSASRASGTHTGTMICTNALCVGAALLLNVEPPCDLEFTFDARWTGTSEE